MAEDKNQQLSNEEIKALSNLASLLQLAQNQGAQTKSTAPAARVANPTNNFEQIDLIDLFWFLVYKIKWIALVCVIGTLLGGVYGYAYVKPVYSATAKLYILSAKNSAINISDLQLGSMLTMDYQEVFKTWEVHEMVRQELGLDYSYGQLQSMLSVSNPTSTRVLYITVRNSDPELASRIANAYANAAKQFILMTMDSAEPNTFSMALVPGSAVGRSRSTYVMYGFIAALALIMGILVLMYLLDDRPKTAEDIQKATGLNTLATIPAMDNSPKKKEKRRRK